MENKRKNNLITLASVSSIVLIDIMYTVYNLPSKTAFLLSLFVLVTLIVVNNSIANLFVIYTTKYSLLVFLPALFFWPFHLTIPLTMFCLFTLVTRQTKYFIKVTQAKTYRHNIYGVFFAFSSALVLLVWSKFFPNELKQLNGMIPILSAYKLILAAIGFAFINAFLEEWIFRGIIQQSLLSSGLSFQLSLIIQSCLFAVAHYNLGVPSGGIGIIMTFIYAIGLTVLASKTHLLRLPIFVHISTDLVVFYLMMSR